MLIKLAVCLCSVIGMLLLYMVDKMAVVTSAKKEKNSSLSVLAVSFFKKYATREIMWRVPVEELKLHSLPESLCFRLHKKKKNQFNFTDHMGGRNFFLSLPSSLLCAYLKNNLVCEME